MYKPTMSRTFGISNGSGDSLNVSRPVRLQAKGAPHATDGHVAEAGRLRHLARAPVRRAARRRFQCAHDHLLDLRIGDLARRAGTRFVEQPGHAIGHEPRPPFAHGRRRHPQAARDRRVVAPLGARQHQARPSRQRRSRTRSMRQRIQFSSFLRWSRRGRLWGDRCACWILLHPAIRPSAEIYFTYICYRTLGRGRQLMPSIKPVVLSFCLRAPLHVSVQKHLAREARWPASRIQAGCLSQRIRRHNCARAPRVIRRQHSYDDDRVT